MSNRKTEKLKIIPLGGLGEIGKNLTVLEYGEDMIAIDCGLAFPDEDMLGIDMVLPDISYLEANKEKLRAFVITHGHEDHIGSLPYALDKVNVPVYGTRFTLALIEHKLNGQTFESGGTHTVAGDVSVTAAAVQNRWTLSISAGTGSVVSVTRGGTGLADGAQVTAGDVLTVSFSAEAGYELTGAVSAEKLGLDDDDLSVVTGGVNPFIPRGDGELNPYSWFVTLLRRLMGKDEDESLLPGLDDNATPDEALRR